MSELKHLANRDKSIYLMVIIYIIYSITIQLTNNEQYTFTLLKPIAIISTFIQTLLSIGILFYVNQIANKEAYPIQMLIKKIRYLNYNDILSLVSFLLLTYIISSIFTSGKSSIPDLIPYQFDELFIRLDQVLHFNYSPWEISHSIFSSPYMSMTLELSYAIWFLVFWTYLCHFYFFCSNLYLRSQFLISFTLAWLLLGNIAATLLSSVGPCFINNLNPEIITYTPLMERLAQQHEYLQVNAWFYNGLMSLDLQNTLWLEYANNMYKSAGGISAMPSMHVSIATLIALASWRINKFCGIVGTLFCVMILIGSVHLAWHYAIDGYISIISTWVIWHLSGKLSKLKFLAPQSNQFLLDSRNNDIS